MNARTSVVAAHLMTVLLLAIGTPADAIQTAQRSPDEPRERCGTISPTAMEMAQATSRMERLRATSPEASAFRGGTIRVAIHVITNGSVGAVSDAAIAAQMRETNQNFAGTGYRFELVSVDRTDKTNWFKMGPGTGAEKDAKRTLAIDPAHTMNVYICNAWQFYGWAYFPWSFPEDHYLHGIVIDYGTLPGGYQAPYDLGRTLTHEAGHYLGLYHTFQGGCTVPGDEVEDTPYEATPAYGCPAGRNTCSAPGDDPIHNYMDYTDDLCYTEFTPLQDARMDAMVPAYRPSLISSPVTEALAPRVEETHVAASDLSLALKASPNPFASGTNLSFSLPHAGAVSLRVYNVAGQLVATLLDGERTAGVHNVAFRAGHLPPGMYFTRLQLGQDQLVRSVILVP